MTDSVARPKTMEAAHGRWREILPALGLASAALNGKNQPCPSCGGRDRFRFHDRQGDGDYYCNQCGAGKGLTLLMKVNNWNYADAAKRVDELVGNLPKRTVVRREPVKIDTRAEAIELWNSARPLVEGDPAWLYLASRGIPTTSSELRFTERLFNSETGSELPGMLAKVRDVEGRGQTLHRTYLTMDGKKAAVEKCRKMMRGEFPKGGAIRLAPAAEILGVAEGIETALAAGCIFHMPVWSTVSEGFLRTWEPPQEAKRVLIFGDNDKNFVGQNAAYELAKRLSLAGLEVAVKIPERAGADWNDVLRTRNAETRAFSAPFEKLKEEIHARAA
jgi:putative DNA primase/helicase